MPMPKANVSLSPPLPSIYTAIGAACWASYLINGDASGLSNEERELADAWLAREVAANGAIIDCGEPYFTWHYDLFTGAAYRGGDVVEGLANGTRQTPNRSKSGSINGQPNTHHPNA